MRKLLEDGRYSDSNGTFEEKFLHYFYAFTASEALNMGYILENAELRTKLNMPTRENHV